MNEPPCWEVGGVIGSITGHTDRLDGVRMRSKTARSIQIQNPVFLACRRLYSSLILGGMEKRAEQSSSGMYRSRQCSGYGAHRRHFSATAPLCRNFLGPMSIRNHAGQSLLAVNRRVQAILGWIKALSAPSNLCIGYGLNIDVHMIPVNCTYLSFIGKWRPWSSQSQHRGNDLDHEEPGQVCTEANQPELRGLRCSGLKSTLPNWVNIQRSYFVLGS